MFVSLYWFTNTDIALFSVDSIAVDMKERKITAVGEADPVCIAAKLRKLGYKLAELLSLGPANEEKNDAEKEEKNDAENYIVNFINYKQISIKIFLFIKLYSEFYQL